MSEGIRSSERLMRPPLTMKISLEEPGELSVASLSNRSGWNSTLIRESAPYLSLQIGQVSTVSAVVLHVGICR